MVLRSSEHTINTTVMLDSKNPRAFRWESAMFFGLLLAAAGAAYFLSFAFSPLDFCSSNSAEVTAAPVKRMYPTALSTTENSVVLWKDAKDWVRLIALPLVVQVGSLVLVQGIAIPLVAQPLLQAGRIMRIQQHPWVQVVARQASTFVHMVPKAMRNVPRVVAKLFKKRSRLSVASEFTNFVGNEEE